MLILFIILYFSIVGGLFYKLYISTPAEQKLVNGPVIEPGLELERAYAHEPVRSKLISNGAADIKLG